MLRYNGQGLRWNAPKLANRRRNDGIMLEHRIFVFQSVSKPRISVALLPFVKLMCGVFIFRRGSEKFSAEPRQSVKKKEAMWKNPRIYFNCNCS
jgi:hypothetical protein